MKINNYLQKEELGIQAGKKKTVQAYGTSEGAVSGWDTKGRGRKEAQKEDVKWANSKPKFQFTKDEINQVQNHVNNFNNEHDKDWQDENEDSKESFRDQSRTNKNLISSMQKGDLEGAYRHGIYNGDDENFGTHTRNIERVLNGAMKRDPGSWNRMKAVYDKYGN